MTEVMRTFTLLSGGIDSSTTLARAIHDFPGAEAHIAVTVDYGQRHIKEAESASNIVEAYRALYGVNIEHRVINLQGLMTGMLVGTEQVIPNAAYSDLPQGISPTYVSFRNGLMLSSLAAFAQSWIMDQEGLQSPGGQNTYEATLYCGVHADDGANWAYPDCSPEFIGGMANAIHIGTYNKARLRTPLLHMSKAEVVELGLKMHVPYELAWSCYKGEELHCGTCPTCRSRKEAFELLGERDPTEYAQ